MAVISKRHAANAILHATVARRLPAELQLRSNCYRTAVYTLTYRTFCHLFRIATASSLIFAVAVAQRHCIICCIAAAFARRQISV